MKERKGEQAARSLFYGALKPFVAHLDRVRIWNAAHSG
jgi:hypothetical protein